MLRIICAIPLGKFLLSLIYRPKSNPVQLFGSTLNNPVGLAAGMDKGGVALTAWDSIGFGFIEIGGITKVAQAGNPKPRMFRDNRGKFLINRMGFNNPGSEEMSRHLSVIKAKNRMPRSPLWINVGKSKSTPNSEAADDYRTTISRLYEFADAFVINISSPNTPGLRELQVGEDVSRIISSCKQIGDGNLPMLLKLSPDLDQGSLQSVVKAALDSGIDGFVATNTTLERPVESKISSQEGGLSGTPLNRVSTEMIAEIWKLTEGKVPIIGVGGIMSAEDAWQKIIHGASAVQVYTGLVFNGAGMVKSLNRGIRRRLKQSGFSDLSEAIGSAVEV